MSARDELPACLTTGARADFTVHKTRDEADRVFAVAISQGRVRVVLESNRVIEIESSEDDAQ